MAVFGAWFENGAGAPERIRTSDLPLRRGSRYPAVPPGLLISLYFFGLDRSRCLILFGMSNKMAIVGRFVARSTYFFGIHVFRFSTINPAR